MSETAATERVEGERGTEFAIVINGELAVVPHDDVSYTEVVSIAYPVPPGPDTTYTVTFRKAKEPRHEGILVKGETVEVRKEGTTFDVVPTGKS
jgi:Multiubiquitin